MNATPSEPPAGLGLWLSARKDPSLVTSLPVQIADPASAWFKVVEDDPLAWPAFQVQAAWIEGQTLHWATVGGFVEGQPDPQDGGTLRAYDRIALADITRMQLDLGDGGQATLELANGETLTGAPGVLLNGVM